MASLEFAFEIGSSLLTEVRRLQSLLAERDKALQDMKEEKDDLDKLVENLTTGLRTQEANAGVYSGRITVDHFSPFFRQIQGGKLEPGSDATGAAHPTF